MKKWTYALCLMMLPFAASGADPLIYKNCGCEQEEKPVIYTARQIDSLSKKIASSLRPKIHQGIWPEFCLEHLQEDAEGCSSWRDDPLGNPQLEFLLDGHAQVQIDRQMIEQLGALAALIPAKTRGDKQECNHAYCPKCDQAVIRSLCYRESEDDKGLRLDYFVAYRCRCSKGNWLDLSNLNKQDKAIAKEWKFCKRPTIYPGYLDWHHQCYSSNLKKFLQYSERNPDCLCYWPETEDAARKISDLAYEKLDAVLSHPYLTGVRKSFSPYLAERTRHGFYSGLLTNAFFDSDYRQILVDLDKKCSEELPQDKYAPIHRHLLDMEDEIEQLFFLSYNNCLEKHPHPVIHCERGKAYFNRGQDLDALEDLRKFIAYADTYPGRAIVSADILLKEGQLFNESHCYEEAVATLTRALEKDLQNSEAYFERAMAYFELGNFDRALDDYLASGLRPKRASADGDKEARWMAGFISGLSAGLQEGQEEFVPMRLGCYRGLNRGLWASVSTPLPPCAELIDAAMASLELIKSHASKDVNKELAVELQECLAKLSQRDDAAIAQLVGRAIGKYGTDIFMGCGLIEASQAFRDLRRANALMSFETLARSSRLKQEMEELSAVQSTVRKRLLESDHIQIQWQRQGLYVKEDKRFSSANSKTLFTHHDPKSLLEECAGKGRMAGHGFPGNPVFKEEVNFHEFIGIVEGAHKEKIATTWGVIHYAPDGVHIVPMRPRS